MGYVEAFRAIESTFSEAIVLGSPDQINQNGVYLVFDGSKAKSMIEDELKFLLIIAAHSYMGENGAMGKVQEFREMGLNSPFALEFAGCRGMRFENSSLYFVSMEFNIEINVKEECKL